MKSQKAMLLSQPDLTVEDRRIGKLLSFFGVPHRKLSISEFLADSTASQRTAANSRIFCSAEVFLRLIEGLERNPECLQSWHERIHSAFVYAGSDPEVLQKLARILTGDDGTTRWEINPSGREFVVSEHLNDFCGAMVGVRVAASEARVDPTFILKAAKGNAINIISIGHGATFLKLNYHQAPVFLSTCNKIIDIGAELATGIFDIRDHVQSAMPVVLYVKWAFAETCWNPAETNACLVIDDPVLKPTYGFVNFHELLALMKCHRFSTNIAFIPWNWRRSDPGVVRLFKENPEKYSLSIHGFDHTAAEFGSHDRQRLYWKAKQAVERMTLHETNTGIRYDRVMVFPQGVFSKAAMSALKHTELIGAVNNDVISDDPHPRAITISEVWDVAVMGYSSFPIFMRRNPWEGIENFAFDILLGKPCIVVIHHGFCRDQCKDLVRFVERLNALKDPPTWRSLGEVVRRSCRQRQLSRGAVEIEMYGTELRVENCSERAKRFVIKRRESDPSVIKGIRVGSVQVAWNFSEGCIVFEIELDPGQSSTVSIGFHGLGGNERYKENVGYRVKTMVRRYLCEVRDNYVMTAKSRLAGLGRKTAKAKRTPNAQRPTLNVQ